MSSTTSAISPYGTAGPRSLAKLGAFVGAAADRHLIILLAVLLDAENADVAHVMVAAGIDAARDVDVQPAEALRQIEILEPARDLLGHRDRARIGEAAIVEAGTGDDVGDQTDVGRGGADPVERPPQRRQIALGDVRQHQILLVPDADLAEAVAIRQIGDGVHLRRGGIAGRSAHRLERQGHDGIAGALVVEDRVVEPGAEAPVRGAGLAQRGRIVRQRLVVGVAEPRRDPGRHRRVERQRAVPDRPPFLLDLAREFLGAELVHQDLDARLVDIVAPAVLVVGAQDRLDVAQKIALRQERLDGLGDERRAAEPAADHHLEAALARAVAVHAEADVVHPHRRAVVRGGSERDLELARQEREFRMQGEVLAQQLRPDARILDLVGRDAAPTGRW